MLGSTAAFALLVRLPFDARNQFIVFPRTIKYHFLARWLWHVILAQVCFFVQSSLIVRLDSGHLVRCSPSQTCYQGRERPSVQVCSTAAHRFSPPEMDPSMVKVHGHLPKSSLCTNYCSQCIMYHIYEEKNRCIIKKGKQMNGRVVTSKRAAGWRLPIHLRPRTCLRRGIGGLVLRRC